ncbi:hypothetical protein PFISCL1PPCAC_21471, partial [Pristionchus fissidentatus]
SEMKCGDGSSCFYTLSVIRSSMFGIMQRFQHLKKRIAGNITMTFHRANEYHVELLESAASLELEKLTVTCEYNGENRHSAISDLMTDDYLKALLSNKEKVILNLVGKSVSAKFLHSLFKVRLCIF